ncbi:hypothetical protein T01_3356 [Trichinella spiralis]|uniref:Uncharacterized protein n=1 Tax=Trichinella spiralis TaxID=6334 RepID=A0A0V1BXV8_TRISP|nr:hypothetical protein T01_3356 [Trichinella spiralis]
MSVLFKDAQLDAWLKFSDDEGSLKPKPLAGFVFRGRLGMFEYFRSLNLVDKFAHTSVNSAPSKRESSLSKFHFSDIGRFAGRQQTSTIQANFLQMQNIKYRTILMNIMLIFIQHIMRSRFIRGVFRNDEKFDYIKLRAGYISFGHNDDR